MSAQSITERLTGYDESLFQRFLPLPPAICGLDPFPLSESSDHDWSLRLEFVLPRFYQRAKANRFPHLSGSFSCTKSIIVCIEALVACQLSSGYGFHTYSTKALRPITTANYLFDRRYAIVAGGLMWLESYSHVEHANGNSQAWHGDSQKGSKNP